MARDFLRYDIYFQNMYHFQQLWPTFHRHDILFVNMTYIHVTYFLQIWPTSSLSFMQTLVLHRFVVAWGFATWVRFLGLSLYCSIYYGTVNCASPWISNQTGTQGVSSHASSEWCLVCSTVECYGWVCHNSSRRGPYVSPTSLLPALSSGFWRYLKNKNCKLASFEVWKRGEGRNFHQSSPIKLNLEFNLWKPG